MFKKLLSALGAKTKTPATKAYGSEELNAAHNMLFADDAGQLFGDDTDARLVQGIARDSNEESRVRLLAAQWLRARGHKPEAPEVLGVIVEVPLEEGLDTLAAYADGRVRYINQTGRMAVFEGAPADVAAQAKALVATALAAAAKGSSQKPASVPGAGQLRFTFLSQEGNRITEGFFSDIVRNTLAKPVLEQAQLLLDRVVKQGNAQ